MTDSTILRRLIAALLDEHEEWRGMALPSTQSEQRLLFRALRNVREPKAVDEEWIKWQDEELQRQLAEKGVVEINDTPASDIDNRLRLWQGDITRLRVDAIVNAANSRLLGCFVPNHRCIDNAIHSAAGVQLREQCNRIMLAQGHDEPTGSAKITSGYNLPSKHVIHTVGPIIPDGIPTPEQERQLASCYRSCLDIASRENLQSIAFCCISTGEFRFPNRLAAEIAVRTVVEWLSAHDETTLDTIIFNVFKDDDKRIYEQILFKG